MNFGIHKMCLAQAEVVIMLSDREAVPVCETVTLLEWRCVVCIKYGGPFSMDVSHSVWFNVG